ncbi:hypothetical protein [Streptomyces sp. NPDC004270]
MSSLAYSVHTAGDTGLNKSSVLVTGEREALLVDGQFTLAEQHGSWRTFSTAARS